MRLLSFLALGLLALVGTRLVSPLPSSPEPPERVPPVKPARASATRTAMSMAGVVVRSVVEVRTETTGVVRLTHVRLGERVRKGQMLVTLDAGAASVDLAAKLSSVGAAEAEWERAAVLLAQATERDGRNQSARKYLNVEEASASAYAVQLAAAEASAARHRRGEARAQAAAARLRFNQLEVRAPIDGVVSDTFVVAGALAEAQGMLVRLVSNDAPRLRFAVPEDSLRHVRLGQHVDVAVESMRVTATVDALAPDIDALSGLRFAEASFNEALELPAGLSVVVSVEAP